MQSHFGERDQQRGSPADLDDEPVGMDEHRVDQVLDQHTPFCGGRGVRHRVDVERSEQCCDFFESVAQIVAFLGCRLRLCVLEA